MLALAPPVARRARSPRLGASAWSPLVWVLPALLAANATAEESRPRADSLVVHEWGTFTALQDETGRALGGINVDDEPVPPFVHNLNRYVLGQPFLTRSHWFHRMKGAPRHHPQVTLRLETPVLYFYPGDQAPRSLDVAVQFRGGWLTEFYPLAEADAPGLSDNQFEFAGLGPQTVSSLTWRDVRIGGEVAPPETDWPVWLAPRRTSAPRLSVGDEGEHYLFYRGVGRIDAPLRTSLDRQTGTLAIRPQWGAAESAAPSSTQLARVWLVDVRSDGAAAYRIAGPVPLPRESDQVVAELPYRFADSDYSTEHMRELRQELHAALVADGLFADEATAMLDTWERAYFRSVGLRLFFLVPRQWTDHHLPLELSRPAVVQRAMMGRIELISDRQRRLLDELAATPPSDGKWVESIPESPQREAFLSGRSSFGDLGVPIPADYQRYLDLGRFRNALVTAESRRTADPELQQFIENYGLQPFLP